MTDNTTKKAYELGSQARHFYDEAQDYMKNGADNVTGCIKQHPFMSAGIAFVAGMVFAKLLKD